MRRAKLAIELSDLDDAISALEANPEVEKVLNLISKTRRY